MYQINFNTNLKSIEGEDLKDENGKVITLKATALNALLGYDPSDRSMSGEEKASRYLLAVRIQSNPERIELKSEEITKIKQSIGKIFGPLIVGQAWELLDGTVKEEEKK